MKEFFGSIWNVIKSIYKFIIKMAETVIHGGLDQIFTSHTHSQHALTNHTHSQYLTTAALSNHIHSQYASTNHTHSQYLTTAAISNHTHPQYVNTSVTGNLYFKADNNIVFGSIVSGMSTTITAAANITGASIGNLVFLNSNGHTFGSSANAGSTFYWIVTK